MKAEVEEQAKAEKERARQAKEAAKVVGMTIYICQFENLPPVLKTLLTISRRPL